MFKLAVSSQNPTGQRIPGIIFLYVAVHAAPVTAFAQLQSQPVTQPATAPAPKASPQQELQGRIVWHDDSPIKAANVFAVQPDEGVCIYNGHMNSYARSLLSATTDERGTFTLAEPPGRFVLIALHDRGYAFMMKDELTYPLKIQLIPWGRLRGALRFGNQPGAFAVISAWGTEPEWDEFNIDFNNFADADENGEFEFKRLIPGYLGVSRLLGGSGMATYEQVVGVEVEPNQTAFVRIGGIGRQIVGRFKPLKDLVDQVDWDASDVSFEPSLSLVAAFVEGFKEGLGVPKTPNACDQNRPYYFEMPVKQDGSFRAYDVPAGSYELTVLLSNGNRFIGQSTLGFTVPAQSSKQAPKPHDLGTIRIKVKTGPSTTQPKSE
jgi:hypothetical protein